MNRAIILEIISRFTGQYRFLSNFWPCSILYGGMTYPSVEHGYQAIKTLDRLLRREICGLPSAAKAKKFGRNLVVRYDWEEIKLRVMLKLLRLKFKKTALTYRLLKTGESKLVEGNSWNDQFWGVCNGEGSNHLGILLMKVRSECRLSERNNR